jgi:hypothetical protein
VSDIFLAASALDIDLTNAPEMAWVAEFLLSRQATLPAGWEENEVVDPLTNQKSGLVRYRNTISEEDNLSHPFRVEVYTLMSAVEARAKQILDAALAEMDAGQKRDTGYDDADIDAIDAGSK